VSETLSPRYRTGFGTVASVLLTAPGLTAAALGLRLPGMAPKFPPPLEAEAPRGHRIGAHLLLVALSGLPYLFFGQTWLLLTWAATRLTVDPAAPLPDAAGVSTIPGRLVLFHLLFVAVLPLPRRWQLWAASAGALAIGLGIDAFGFSAVALLALFALAFYGLFRLPIPRWTMLGAIVLAVPLLRTAAGALGVEALARPSISTGLIVLLWYACYAVTTGKLLTLRKYFAYVKTRLFMEGPVFTLQDFDPADPRQLFALRLAGIEALSIAALSRTVSVHLGQALEAASWTETTGLALLGLSYLNYLALALQLVFSYNLYLGLLRLFGLPIRDNFNWWILARTPNEHWRRWNLLLREWLVTFTFFPMMRAKISLFVSVMATLLVSGALHVWARVGTEPWNWEQTAITLGYWTINGLAIYVVVAFPRRWPRLTRRIGLDSSKIWWVVGWILTSAFYGVLFTINHDCDTLAEVPAYLARLIGVAS
jgi:D-alanyl-lipoteichoic acid acyltransferase DltB (MBOAT superfamily)